MVSALLVTQGDSLLCGKTRNESDFMQRLHDPTQGVQTRGIGKKMFPRLKERFSRITRLEGEEGKNKTKQTNKHLSCTNFAKIQTKYTYKILDTDK